MSSFEHLSETQIRAELVRTGQYTEEQALAIKGKGDLLFALMEATSNSDGDEDGPLPFEGDLDFELEDESQHYPQADKVPFKPEETSEYREPKLTDDGWHDFVMSKFREDELINGNPKVSGLRRVAELLLGEIVSSGPVTVFPATSNDNAGRATVVYEVEIAWKRDLEPWVDLRNFELPLRRFRAVAEVWVGNVDDAYAIFPVSVAETRAEGRALRKALNIQAVAAEELTNKNAVEVLMNTTPVQTGTSEWEGDDPISSNQIAFIETKCTALGIDVEKFINKGFYTGEMEHKAYDNINQVSRKVAASMIAALNKYQSNTGSNESTSIPSVILLSKGT